LSEGGANVARDPVCGMEVAPGRSDWVTEYRGWEYRFCSEGCMKAFNTRPSMYLERDEPHEQGHYVGHGAMGGCCGAGMGRGWMRYFYIGLLVLYVLSLFTR